jgi:hypothetical protein
MNVFDPQGLYLNAQERLQERRAEAARQRLVDQLPRRSGRLRLTLAAMLYALAKRAESGGAVASELTPA